MTNEDFFGFITGFIKRRGVSPTYKEIRSSLRIGNYAISKHLKSLESSGRIIIQRGKRRGIHLAGDKTLSAFSSTRQSVKAAKRQFTEGAAYAAIRESCGTLEPLIYCGAGCFKSSSGKSYTFDVRRCYGSLECAINSQFEALFSTQLYEPKKVKNL